jgi:hypothetical protein
MTSHGARFQLLHDCFLAVRKIGSEILLGHLLKTKERSTSQESYKILPRFELNVMTSLLYFYKR